VGLRHESGADGHGAAEAEAGAASAAGIGSEPAVRWRRGDRRERERSGWGGGRRVSPPFSFLFSLFLFLIFEVGFRGVRVLRLSL